MSTTLINFKKAVGNVKISGRGIPVGEWLIVSYSINHDNTYQVYRLHDGRLFVSVEFTALEDALEMAKWWDELYRDYMIFWKDYPDADIIALAKWSVKNGIRMHELIQQIAHQQVDKSLLSKAWDIAEQKVRGWRMEYAKGLNE